MLVRGGYDEFADRWVVAQRFGQEEFRTPGFGINALDGAPFIQNIPAVCPQAFRVTVYAKEVLTARSDTVFATDQQILGGRNVSVLKARVTWHMFAEIPRVIELDIGSGFDISVGPTDRVQVDVLVPDLSSVPATLPTVSPGHVQANYNTAVECVIMCDPAGGAPNWIGRWTQSEFLLTGTASNTRLVEIKPSTRFVQIFSDSTGMPNPEFITLYDFNPAASPNLGLITWDPADTNTDRVEIPQGATHILLTAAAANVNGARVTVVQELFR